MKTIFTSTRVNGKHANVVQFGKVFEVHFYADGKYMDDGDEVYYDRQSAIKAATQWIPYERYMMARRMSYAQY